jgi:tetratricopeptide (TPR) repeat protein
MQARLLILTLAIALVIPCVPALAKEQGCINWSRVMAQAEVDRLPAGRVVLVQNFTDYTKVEGDEWLAAGIRDLMTDLLRSALDLRVLAGATASAATGPPDASVGGSFQHANGQLRIFVAATDGGSGQLLKQIEVLVPYPGNAAFFARMADAAQQILTLLKAKSDGSALAAVRDATASTRAFESYARGRQALQNFTAGKAEVAKAFFDDAVRIDGTSPLGYLGQVDLHSFLGFSHKQRKEPFELEFQRAEEAMNRLRAQARRAIPMTAFRSAMPAGKGGGVVNRYLAGNAAFLEGVGLAQAGNQAAAQKAFTKSVEAVPEDAISWYHLSRSETALGNAAAATAALQKAYGINSCIEQ